MVHHIYNIKIKKLGWCDECMNMIDEDEEVEDEVKGKKVRWYIIR